MVILRAEELVDRIFCGRIFEPGLFIPSSNAGWGASRADGGSFGALLQLFRDRNPEASPCSLDVPVDPWLCGRRTVPVLGLDLVQPFLNMVEEEVRSIVDRGFLRA